MREPLERSGSLWVPSRREMLGALGVGLLAPRIARAGMFGLVSHRADYLGQNGGTSGSIDTTGADLLVLVIGNNNSGAGTVTDSKSNTWYALTTETLCTIHYAKNPTVGPGHTITLSAGEVYASVCFAAFSGANIASPFDQENGAPNDNASPGSITPSVDNCLVVGGATHSGLSTRTVDGSMTLLDTSPAGYYTCCQLAYRIQTTKAAINPVWTPTFGACVIASFKPTIGGPVRHRVITGGE